MNLSTLQTPIDYGFFDFSVEKYNNIRALNNSSLKLGEISPYHIDCALDKKYVEEDKKDFEIGRAYHHLIFEPDVFDRLYTPFNRKNLPVPDKDLRNGQNKAYKEKLYEDAAKDGLEVLEMSDYETFLRMREGLFVNKDIRALIESTGKIEHTMVWQHPEFKINCKGRVDKLIPGAAIIDLKSIKDLRDWDYQYNHYGYKFQSSFYHEGYTSLTNDDSIWFVFIYQEKKFPYCAKAKRLLATNNKLLSARKEYYKYIQDYIDYKSGNLSLDGLEDY